MGVIGTGIGAGLKAVGGIFGGIAASKAIRKAKANIEGQMKENQDWYDRRYNEDATQRADAQAILTQTEESIRNRNRQAAGAQAVMGGTDEGTAAAKAANNEALATATSAIAMNAEKRKDAIEQQYMNNKANLNQQLNDLEHKRAEAVTGAINGVSDAANGIAGIL